MLRRLSGRKHPCGRRHDTGPLDPVAQMASGWRIRNSAAGKSARGGRITSGEWEASARTCAAGSSIARGVPSLLVAEGGLNTPGSVWPRGQRTGRGLTTVPIFLLVPQVKLRQAARSCRDAHRWRRGAIPGAIVANLGGAIYFVTCDFASI